MMVETVRASVERVCDVNVFVLMLDTLICADVRRDVEIVEAAKAPVAWTAPRRLSFVAAAAWITTLDPASSVIEPAAR